MEHVCVGNTMVEVAIEMEPERNAAVSYYDYRYRHAEKCFKCYRCHRTEPSAYRRPLSLKQARCKWLMVGKPHPTWNHYNRSHSQSNSSALHLVTWKHEVMTNDDNPE
jgi:hypothetical protein